MTGQRIIEVAEPHIGERYLFGAVAPKNDPLWRGPWDCAEFCSWAVYQVSQKLYGCYGTYPPTADAYTGKWNDDADRKGTRIPVSLAASTPGAFVLRVGTKVGHIVISDGKGGTIEAHSARLGVIRHTLHGRSWTTGILIPWISYEGGNEVGVELPKTQIYRLRFPYMRDDKIALIQMELRDLGFYEGKIDGVFGPHTHNAVVRFQETNGLVIDGEVGPQTLGELGIA